MNNTQLTNSPYKGLQPYTERDRYFFFGRERDQEIITSNLFASSLTVFYGASGVGKSSVLLAGVVPILREAPRVAVTVFRDWQDTSFETSLKSKVLEAIGADAQTGIDPTLEFDEFLLACMRAFRGSLFIILDQFEEYFLYHPLSPKAEEFDAAFARAINRSEIGANFLLSMRDDGLSRLDRFQKRIPNLLNNMLRLEHLDRRSAELAIRNPLTRYNETLTNGQLPVQIEKELVNVLLDDLQAGRVTLDLTGQGRVAKEPRADKTGRIETPFLQVVLTRLWEDEHQTQIAAGAKSVTLKLDTYARLGGAKSIVRTHLDKTMASERLLPHRETAAALFHFLVTPTGMKIAHTVDDLTSYAKRPPAEVEGALNELSEPDVRILRPIAPPPGHQELRRYEIFHDVLAPAILDWRSRVVMEQAEAQAKAEAEQQLFEQRKEAERQAMAQRLEQATALAEAERQRAEAEALRAQLEGLRATEQTRTAGRLRTLVTGLAAMVLLTGAATVFAAVNWRRANEQTKLAGMETARANVQAGLARAAESRADDLRKKAEEQSARANEQAALATEREKEATEARAATDDALKRVEKERERAEAQARIAESERKKAEELKAYADAQRAAAVRSAEEAKMARDNEALYREALSLSRRLSTRQQAIPKLTEVLRFFRERKDQPALTAALLSFGQVHAELDYGPNANIAEESFNEAIRLAATDKDKAMTRARIADIYRELAPWLSSTPKVKAMALYNEVYKEFGKLNDRASQAGVKVSMGITLGEQAGQSPMTEGNRQFLEALKHIEDALVIYKELKDERNVALALWHAGEVAQRRQSNEMRDISYNYFSRSLEAYRKLDDKRSVAMVLRRLVYLDELMDKPDKALAGYQEIPQIFHALNDPISESLALVELGIAFANQYADPNRPPLQKLVLAHDAPGLIERMKTAADSPTFIANPMRRGILLTSLGRIYQERQDYEAAFAAFEKALAAFKLVLGQEYHQVYVLNGLIRVSGSMKKQGERERFLAEAEEIIPRVQVPSQKLAAAVQFGGTALDAKEDKVAAKAFKIAIEIAREVKQPTYLEGSIARTLQAVGTEYSRRGRVEEALPYFTESSQLFRDGNLPSSEAVNAVAIAEGYLVKQDHVKAIEYFEQALQINKKMDYHEATVATLKAISASYRSLGNNAKAQEYQREADALGARIAPPPAPPRQ